MRGSGADGPLLKFGGREQGMGMLGCHGGSTSGKGFTACPEERKGVHGRGYGLGFEPFLADCQMNDSIIKRGPHACPFHGSRILEIY
jgi:hypothetical protein